MEPYVNLTIENSIGTIDFFHPQSNSLPRSLLQELADTIKSSGENDQIKVVILLIMLSLFHIMRVCQTERILWVQL